MKILLVDDSVQRTSRLEAAIGKLPGCKFFRAESAAAARALLAEIQFDLMVLDISLPLHTGGPPSQEVSLDLVQEMFDSSAIKKPKNVLGITAFDEAFEAARTRFAELLWALIRVDDLNSDWVETLINSIQWIEKRDDAATTHSVDVLVVAALPVPEMSALYSLEWSWSPARPADSTMFVRHGKLQVRDRTVSVVASSPTRMGMVSTAVCAAKLIHLFRPRVCAMIGICAGAKGKVRVGDIIFADSVWDYQSGKHTARDGRVFFEIAPHQIAPAESLRVRFEQMARDQEWLRGIAERWSPRPDRAPELHVGPFGSGSAVLADGKTFKEVSKTQQRRLLGVDMELYGLFSAAANAGQPSPLFFGVKSVCDFADQSKSDAHQQYAAYTSAAALDQFVRRHLLDVL